MLHTKEAFVGLSATSGNGGPAFLSMGHDDASGTATCRQCLHTLAMLGSARTPSMAARWFMISGSRSTS